MARSKKIDVDEIIDGVAFDSEERAGDSGYQAYLTRITSEDMDPPLPKSKTKTYSTSTTTYSKGSYEKCHHTHPALVLKHPDGREGKFYGGACADPVKNCDIYVALDWNTTHMDGAWPWDNKGITFVPFHIRDMSVPDDADEFIAMIYWLAEQALSGKTVHIGCLGGHGRTGMVLSALTKVITGNEHAITYVREHYCKKVVETGQQVSFLAKHFDIHETDGSKESKKHYSSTSSYVKPAASPTSGWGTLVPAATNFFEQHGGPTTDRVDPVKTSGNLWGKKVVDIRY